MNYCRSISVVLFLSLFLTGCVGYVAGDLKNTKSAHGRPASGNYKVLCKSDAKDDCGDQNISGWITTLTLGIIPTYWSTEVHSEATIVQNGEPVYTKKYSSRIHKFYGILWSLVLPYDTINALQSDEGGGIRTEWGIRDRTYYRIVADHGGNLDQYMLVDDPSP